MYLFELAEMYGRTAEDRANTRKATSAAEARKQTYADGYEAGLKAGKQAAHDAVNRYYGSRKGAAEYRVLNAIATYGSRPDPDLC